MLMTSQTIKGLRNKFITWNQTFQSIDVKVIFLESIAIDYQWRHTKVKFILVRSVACWIKRVTLWSSMSFVRLSMSFLAGNVREILARQWTRKKSCDDSKFSYLGHSLSSYKKCEDAVTTRTRCGWGKFR